MKNLCNVRMVKLFGVIALAAIIGMSMGACSSEPEPEPGIGRVTITGIPSEYNGKFAVLLVDMGDVIQGYDMRTISGSSAIFNMLDYGSDQLTTLNPGNYLVSLVIADTMSAVADEDLLYIGIILSKAFTGQTVSISFGEFIDFTNL